MILVCVPGDKLHVHGDQIQHVPFVLNTSGSIGSAQGSSCHWTAASSLLQASEVCSNDLQPLCSASTVLTIPSIGRTRVTDAIKGIKYHGGGTRTAGTARCVCKEILQPACGIDVYPDSLGVVFFKSNDPSLGICNEVSAQPPRN